MSNKNLLIASLATFTLAGASNANADLLSYYGDGTLADAAALANVAPAVADTTVSALSDFGAQTNDANRITRDGFSTPTPAGPSAGSSAGSEWFEARSSENQGTPSSTDNYFVFTVDTTGGKTLNLTSLKYDFWLSDATDPGTDTVADAEAFISVDSGAFVSFGSIQATDLLGIGVSAPVASANLDLSSITGAQSVEVRIGIGYSQGNSTGISGFVQGIQLEGDVVPEPTSLALLGLGGLMMLRRRRA